eukprot:m.51769 g.51769  ORF g.51769 m.51769 type:complete len:66 (+) comp12246_c1_seq1:91-288(+)
MGRSVWATAPQATDGGVCPGVFQEHVLSGMCACVSVSGFACAAEWVCMCGAVERTKPCFVILELG